jgi:hypothetical protein
MKMYLNLFIFGVSIALSNVFAQSAPGNTAQASTQTSEALATVESATQALKDSVANDDKNATLELLAAACKAFPDSAESFVTTLILAISQMNANSPSISARNVALGGKANDVNPSLVAEIVATAINAAPGSQIAIVAAAIQVAPNAAAQINAAAASPLTFTSTDGSTGVTFDPPNTPPTPAS